MTDEEDLDTGSAAPPHGECGAMTAEKLEKILEAGKGHARGARESTLRAAACGYLLCDIVAFDHVDKLSKEWLAERIEKHKEAIEKSNKAAELARENGDFADLDDKQFKDRHIRSEIKVPVTVDEAILAVVKLVFELDRRVDASHATRRATVTRWIKARFAGAETPTEDEIVTAIKDVGGFEVALDLQRAVEGGGARKPPRTPNPPEQTDDGSEKDGRASVKVQVKLPQGQTALPEGRCTMVAQCSAGLIEIVSIKPIDEDGDSEDTAPSASSPTIPMKVAPPTQPAPAPEEVPA
ncbi:MAG: hypothetical protein KIT85_19335 [Pseudolabrys sp.]|nr:hypothetical protein [Pseudolabrys sp.]